jgi:hypothetical protein
MKIMHVTTGALTLLLLAPLEANAGARGVGMRTSHVGGQHVVRGHRALARQHFRAVRNQAFGLWPYGYGNGYYDEPPYTYNDPMTYPTPKTVVVKPEPPPCQHSEQTRKVPSANGGTAEVTILRC